MNRVIATLVGRLGFQIEDGKLKSFRRQLTQTERRMRAARSEVHKARRAFRQFSVTAGTLVKGYIAMRIGRTIVGDFARAGDAAREHSRRVGMTAEEYQKLGFVAETSKTNIDTMTKGLVRSARVIRDADKGVTTARDAFRNLGISVRDTDGQLKGQYQIMLEIADAMQGVSTETEKMALLQDVYGRGAGAEMIQVLDQGSEAIRAKMQEAEKLGSVIDEDLAKVSEEYTDNVVRLRHVLRGLRNNIAKDLLPAITNLIGRFVSWYKEGNNARRMIVWLQRIAKAAGMIIAAMITHKLIKLWGAGRTAIYHLMRAVVSLGKAGLIANIKMGLLVAAVALAVLLVEDLIAFAQGRESLIGMLLPEDEADMLRTSLREIWAILKEVGAELKEAGGILWAELKPHIPAIIKFFAQVAVWTARILAFAIHVTAVLLKGWRDAMRWIGRQIYNIGKWFSDAYHTVADKLAPALSLIGKILTPIGKLIYTVLIWPLEKTIGLIADAYRWLRGGDIGAAMGAGAEAAAAMMGGDTRVNQTTSVGSVEVRVDGSTNMGVEDMTRAVSQGVDDGLRGVFTEIAMPVGAS